MSATRAEPVATAQIRCPMIECRRVLELGPEDAEGCMHLIAVWPAGRMAEAVLRGLTGNRELVIRNLRPTEIDPERIESQRHALEEAARRFAREVADAEGAGALFGDTHERNRVAFEFAQLLLGPDPMAQGGAEA